jgi:hypothetical protein
VSAAARLHTIPDSGLPVSRRLTGPLTHYG